MAWKTFRVAIGPYGTPPIGMYGGVYQKVNMGKVERDDTGRWDATNYRWSPVLTGEAPRPVVIHAQLFMQGGILDGVVGCNCKIIRNGTVGHQEPNEPVSGVFGGHSGGAAGQMTYIGVANPGDYFEVWTYCTAWQTGQPAINSYGYGSNTFKLDTHYAHSFMQGAVYDDSALVALQTLVATQGAQLTAAEALLATYGTDIADLQSRVAALEAGGC